MIVNAAILSSPLTVCVRPSAVSLAYYFLVAPDVDDIPIAAFIAITMASMSKNMSSAISQSSKTGNVTIDCSLCSVVEYILVIWTNLVTKSRQNMLLPSFWSATQLADNDNVCSGNLLVVSNVKYMFGLDEMRTDSRNHTNMVHSYLMSATCSVPMACASNRDCGNFHTMRLLCVSES